MDAISALTMTYGDYNGPERLKNKANSKPNKANRRPLAKSRTKRSGEKKMVKNDGKM